MAKRPTPRARGYTLIEVLIVLAIAAILVAAVTPSFEGMARAMAVRGASDEFAAAVQFARSEAIRRNANVFVEIDPTTRTWTVKGGGEVLRQTTWAPRVEATPKSKTVLLFAPSGRAAEADGQTLQAKADAIPDICLKAGDANERLLQLNKAGHLNIGAECR